MRDDNSRRDDRIQPEQQAQAGRAERGDAGAEAVVIHKTSAVGRSEVLTPEMLDEYIEYIHNGGHWLENKQLQRENRQLQRETYTQNVDFVHKSDQLRDRLHRHLLDRRMSLYPKLRPQPFAVVDATKLWGVPVLEDDRLPKGSWYVVNGVLEITP